MKQHGEFKGTFVSSPDCSYPYAKSCGDCHQCQGNIGNKRDVIGNIEVPICGPIKGSLFRVTENNPYLVDTTNVTFGSRISFSESINTRITRIQDISCINLAGTVDMTNNTFANKMLNNYLCDTISSQYKTLNQRLPVMKNTLQFMIHFTVNDTLGNEVYESNIVAYSDKSCFHYTDADDTFVSSFMGSGCVNIPALTYQGMYVLCIDRIVAFADIVSNSVSALNPYYSFNPDKTKITLDHEAIESAMVTKRVPVADIDIDYRTEFNANMSTRLKFRFTSFIDNPIWATNTYNVYSALYRPMDSIVDELVNRVKTLEEQMESLQPKNVYKTIEFDKDYLFDSTYGALDYCYAKDFFLNNTFDSIGGCTSVRKGNFFGRNFDWYYNNFAYSRVRIERSKTAKYWSICNCGNIAELTNEFVKSGQYSEMYKILPFHCLDGINEKHVLCSMNVVPIGDYGLTTGTTPTMDKRDTICVVMIARYILDNFASATEAVTYLKEHVSVYAPLKKDGTRQEIHVMVCDQTKTYLIEFINNEMVVTDMDVVYNGRDYMTNFYNYQTSVDENNHIDFNTVTPYGNGLERYDTITDNIGNVNNKDDMFALMKKVWYTHTYDFDTYGWKTELASREYNLKITDPVSKYIPYFNIGKEQFEHRTRMDGKTWQTVFTSVYDIDKCRMYLVTQEDDSDVMSMEYDNHYTKEEIDNMITGVDPIILQNAVGVMIDFDTNEVVRYGNKSFDDMIPYQRKRCNVTDSGAIVAFYGDELYTESGVIVYNNDDGRFKVGEEIHVQTMVYQPKTFYKVEPLEFNEKEDGSLNIEKCRYFVSNKQLPGFKLHPAFINENGDEVDYILLGAFEGCTYDTSESEYNINDTQNVDFTATTGDKLSSIGNAKPVSSVSQELTRAKAEVLANNRGDGWHLYNIKAVSLNQLLMLIECGDNVQTVIGRGVVDTEDVEGYNCASLTGSTVGNGTGNAESTIYEVNGEQTTYTENGKVAVNYRGMENAWGNMYELINGMNIFNNVPYICKDFEYSETKHTGNYANTNIGISETFGFAKYFGYGGYNHDWLFIPSDANGTPENVIGDYLYINPMSLEGYRTPIVSGSWASGEYDGAFALNIFNGTGYYARNVGARLMYYPQTPSDMVNNKIATMVVTDFDMTNYITRIDAEKFIDSKIHEYGSSNYYNKSEVEEMIKSASYNGIDMKEYYTRYEVDKMIEAYSLRDKPVIQLPYEKFPEIGNVDTLYVDTTDWECYAWDETSQTYMALFSNE